MYKFTRRNLSWVGPTAVIISVLCGGCIGAYLVWRVEPVQNTGHQIRLSGYTYTAPLLLCNSSNPSYKRDEGLQSTLASYIRGVSDANVSAYVLELQTNNWAGVNENEGFTPASMLKVPTMISVLKYAEDHEGFLSKEVYYDGQVDRNANEEIKPAKYILPEHTYTIDELLTYAIVYSDNNAELLLDTAIGTETFTTIYNDLGIQLPTNDSPTTDFMSTRMYSYFLRVLFNATYLSPEMSEKALGLMAKAQYTKGIRAGVPSNVIVSQKFGEREVSDASSTVFSRELHDCGIVYIPNNPYLVCVMTKGDDSSTLASAIAGVSQTAYNYLIAHN